MEEHISSALVEVEPAETERKVREVYEWIWDNSTSASLYTHDGIWPVGARLDSDWQPTDYSEVRTAVAFEYVKHR
jgi:hypothetical protein